MVKKYHLIVFGCQMNVSDAERVAGVVENLGYKKTDKMAEASLILVVMCSIRQSAVDRIHGLVDKFETIRKNNRKLKTILTGCILKKDKKIFVEGFDYLLDIGDIKRIPKLLKLKNSTTDGSMVPNKRDSYLDIAPKSFSNFSANVPIMTGCNNFCSYCVVPYVREREVSRPVEDIIREVKKAVNPPAGGGAKEIWLLGQNVNSYKPSFPKLLKEIDNISGEFWIRFTSSHPKDFSDELIRAMAKCKKVTPYLNLPVQSGDDKVLRAMKRWYTIKDYKNKIKKLRKAIPGIALSTDIILGFPGETKQQFNNTVKLFKEIKYDLAYINKYSPRAGTAAAKLKDNVSVEEKKRRERVLTEVLKQTALVRSKKLLGEKTTVLINEKKSDIYFGKNEHYKTVKVVSSKDIVGQLVKVKITSVAPFTLTGEIIARK